MAISHGRPHLSGSHRGSGVALAVKSSYAGRWLDISRDDYARAMAATLFTNQGILVRVLGLYAPVGACLPNFPSNAASIEEESALKAFVDREILWATSRQHILLVGRAVSLATNSSPSRF